MGSSRRRDSRSPSPAARRRRRSRSRSRSLGRDRRRRSRSTSRDRRARSPSPERKRRRSHSPGRDRPDRHPDSTRHDRDRRASRSPGRRGQGDRDDNARRRDRGAADGQRPPPQQQEPQQAKEQAPAAADAPAAAAAGDGEAAQPRRALTGRAGGVYIPPFKLARMMQTVDDKVSPEYQRMTWDALRKSLNGLINKVNAANIKSILPELFQENLVRGQGLMCKSLMKSQVASPSFTPIYAALVAVINTKLPEVGELLLHRVVNQFKRAYKRNDKPMAVAMTKFVAHLVNQAVVGELLALEIMILVLENPSEDGVEVVVEFTKEVGAHLQDVAPQGLMSVFERFRAILHEGEIDKRVQFMIENLFAIRKAGFAASGHPAVKPELDLVEAEDQITHDISLNDQFADRNELNVFRVDEEYEDHEKQWAAVAREILGQEDSESGGGSGASSEEEEESEDEDAAEEQAPRMDIVDATETNVVNLRRTIYLTIMSSMSFEESGHKLLTVMKSAPGHEGELVTMVIECSSQERTYLRYYGNLAQRFCLMDRKYQEHFAQRFGDQYALIHRLETNKLRNTAKLFAHLLATDALPWGVLECIRLTEEDTTSSSRIFIKYLFQDLSENMGLMRLNERLNDPAYQQWFDGIFPKDTQQNVRFAINFFTSIGLGGITDQMRDYYKNMPKNLPPPPPPPPTGGSSSSSDDSSSSDSDSDSSSGSGSSSSSSSSSDDSDSSSSESESEDERRARRRGRR